MTAGPLSLTRITSELYGDVNPYNEARSEGIMDDLWDEGVVICRGDFFGYDYQLTKGGHEYIQNLLDR